MADRKWEQTALSRLIKRRLKDLDIKQVDLAGRLHVHPSYVSQLVAGRVPDLDAPGFIDTYAQALELDPDVFIQEAELWRYNITPPRSDEMSPARAFLLAVTEHLSDETVYRIARGVREQYGEPPPKPPPVQEHQEPAPTSEPS